MKKYINPVFYLSLVLDYFLHLVAPNHNHQQNRKINSTENNAYTTNRIQTAKYNVFTFVPLNLIDQFSKKANLYFLIIAILQTIEEISTSDGKPVILVPLMTIISISALKDLLEDLQRHRMQRTENNRTVDRLYCQQYQKTKWQDLKVGDIVRVGKDEQIPADLLVLLSSSCKGICYVETKSLDGETNLKTKKIGGNMQQIYKDQRDISSKPYKIECDSPSSNLYNFNGLFSSGNSIMKVDINNLLLRGTSLKNTQYIVGVVVYTGHDTKIMLNSIKQKSKTSKLEKKMNNQIIIIFIVQIMLCVMCGVLNSIFQENGIKGLQYLKYDYQGKDMKSEWIIRNIVLRFGNWMLLFTNFVPISLIVTLEMVKFGQGKIMEKDKKMNSEQNGMVNSSNLNEELGQVEIVFSDKTGTLTANQMVFKAIYINNTEYGGTDQHDLHQYVSFNDQQFRKIVRQTDHEQYDEVIKVLQILGICNELIVEEKKKGQQFCQYNGASTDELALAYFAQTQGLELQGTDDLKRTIVYDHNQNKQYQFEILDVIEFNSKRKKMSVIVKYNDQIYLYCKGADNMMFSSKRKEQTETEKVNNWKLNVQVTKYSEQGYRTLVIGFKKIGIQEYQQWKQKYQQSLACQSTKQQLEQEIEQEIQLVAVTAIEDKLQDNVGQTIRQIKKNKIKLWILTGDKTETAINIGYSSGLIDVSQKIFTFDLQDDDLNSYYQQYQQLFECFKSHKNRLCLVLTGETLDILQCSIGLQNVMKIASQLDTVIVARSNPLQKQEIIKTYQQVKPKEVSLAIGDGANDVNMIIQANIGTGIIGKEGQQAARASDYAVNEFQGLKRLLFLYGRECYRKNSYLVFYNFYKNIVLVAPQLWFGIVSGFSGLFIYDTWIFQMYNILFTSIPIVIYALMDYQYPKKQLADGVGYYKQGQQNAIFNSQMFWYYFLKGFYHSSIITFLVLLFLEYNRLNIYYLGSNSHILLNNIGLQVIGMQIFAILIIIVNLQIFTFQYKTGFLSILFIWGQSLLYFVCLYVFGLKKNFECFDYLYKIGANPNFYLCLISVLMLCFLIEMAYLKYQEFDDKSDANEFNGEYKFQVSSQSGNNDTDIDIEQKQSLLDHE